MTDFAAPGHGRNMGARKSISKVMVGGWGVVIASVVALGLGAGCAVDENPYVSLGENLDAAGGEGGAWLGTGGGTDSETAGTAAESAGTAGRGVPPPRASGGTGGTRGSPDAGMGGVGSVPNASGAGGEAGTMTGPNAGNGGSAAGSAGSSGGGVTCPAIGCSPEFQRVYKLDDALEGTLALRAEICQNDFCLETELTVTPDDVAPGAGLGKEVPEPEVRNSQQWPLMSFRVMGGLEGGIELRLSWRLWSQDDATNGDVYRVNVETLDGEQVAGEELANNYERVEIAACTSCLVAQPAPEN
jgi:hypothetical protein